MPIDMFVCSRIVWSTPVASAAFRPPSTSDHSADVRP
jgi:hypothetical protein